MSEPASAVRNGLVLRMSVPGTGEIARVVSEIAVKLAEQLGLGGPDAARVGQAVSDLARQVDPPGSADVSFEFHKSAAELTIQASHGGRTSETRVSLGA